MGSEMCIRDRGCPATGHLQTNLGFGPPNMVLLACGGWVSMYQEKKCLCQVSGKKKVISNSGCSLIDFCQKNCNFMSMAHALAGHIFLISTNQVQPRCQSCVEFNGEFRGWHPFLLILNPLQAVAKSKCGKLPFSIIATTWQDAIAAANQRSM